MIAEREQKHEEQQKVDQKKLKKIKNENTIKEILGEEIAKLEYEEFLPVHTVEKKKKKRKRRTFHELGKYKPEELIPWTQAEDQKVMDLYKNHGGKWDVISRQLPGKNADAVKFRFMNYLKSKFFYMNVTQTPGGQNTLPICRYKRKWTKEEDFRLLQLNDMYEGPADTRYLVIGKEMKIKPEHCKERIRRFGIKPVEPPKVWTEEADRELCDLVSIYGKKWGKIAEILEGHPKRIGERYDNYLRPYLKKSPWTKEDDRLIIELVNEYGMNWPKIAEKVGRSANIIRHRYCRRLSKVNGAFEIDPDIKGVEQRIAQKDELPVEKDELCIVEKDEVCIIEQEKEEKSSVQQNPIQNVVRYSKLKNILDQIDAEVIDD